MALSLVGAPVSEFPSLSMADILRRSNGTKAKGALPPLWFTAAASEAGAYPRPISGRPISTSAKITVFPVGAAQNKERPIRRQAI
jgi:hypothetical protein